MASVIQGSAIGPVSFVVTASVLHPVTPGNYITKYADDTYLIMPASNSQSCSVEMFAEIIFILSINQKKYILSRSRRAVVIPRRLFQAVLCISCLMGIHLCGWSGSTGGHSPGARPSLANVMTRPRLSPPYVKRQTTVSSCTLLQPSSLNIPTPTTHPWPTLLPSRTFS